MSLINDDDEFVSVDGIYYRKSKVSQISRTTNDELVLVNFDNNLSISLSFSEHGIDNSIGDYEGFFEFIKSKFTYTSTASSNTNSASSGDGSTIVLEGKNINTTIVKSLEDFGIFFKDEYFMLETTTNSDDSIERVAVNNDGIRSTNIPNFDFNILDSTDSIGSNKSSIDVTSSESFEIVGYNKYRTAIVIRNLTEGNIYVSMSSPASENDAIEVLVDGNVIIDNYIGSIFVYNTSSTGIISYEEFIK